MTTLQRSSVSFRRQGSSGRIWDDLHIIDQKTGNLHIIDQKTGMPVAAAEKQENKQPENVQANQEEEERKVGDSSPGASPPPSDRQNQVLPEKKGRGCGISTIFGRCMGTPAS